MRCVHLLRLSLDAVDDGWANTSQAVQPWQPKEGFCDHSPIGGPTEENYYCTEDMGLTQADTTAIRNGWMGTIDEVKASVVAGGGFAWQSFVNLHTPNKGDCASFLRSQCKAGSRSQYYQSATLHQFTSIPTKPLYPLPAFEEDLATFLLLRGPYAWLGYGWVGCNAQYEFRPELKIDYGTPLEYCKETQPNVFEREYTKAVAQMNCNTWSGSVKVK